jgi:hypothetical protein
VADPGEESLALSESFPGSGNHGNLNLFKIHKLIAMGEEGIGKKDYG